MPSIYDRFFLRKDPRARSLTVFAKKYIIYVSAGSNHVPIAVSFLYTVSKVTWRCSRSSKYVFLKLLQISVKKSCVEVFE